MFGFRNPGLMRVPPEIALKGGEHDCRNRILHAMFRHVGVGEQAGSGLPKILHGWKVSHWRPPLLVEKTTPYNQTILELRMVDLFPEDVMQGLKVRFGGDWEGFDHLGRTALALAATEGTVNHARLSSVSDAHPVDLSKTLQGLTQGGFLVSTGGRGAVYHLPGEAIPTPEEIFGPAPPIPGSSTPNLEVSTPNLEASTPNLGDNRDANGCLVSDKLKLPVIDDLGSLGPELLGQLVHIAAEPREKGKLSREKMTAVILKLCSGHFLTLRSLAGLVDRKPETLRGQYLSRLVRERKLALAFPTTPSHERQAYTSAPELLH
jgi:ATP-dependent DNA helicase RecG